MFAKAFVWGQLMLLFPQACQCLLLLDCELLKNITFQFLEWLEQLGNSYDSCAYVSTWWRSGWIIWHSNDRLMMNRHHSYKQPPKSSASFITELTLSILLQFTFLLEPQLPVLAVDNPICISAAFSCVLVRNDIREFAYKQNGSIKITAVNKNYSGLIELPYKAINPVTYSILWFRQLQGGVWLFGPDPENKVTVN